MKLLCMNRNKRLFLRCRSLRCLKHARPESASINPCDWIRKAEAAAQTSPHSLPRECPQIHALPRLCSVLNRLHTLPGLTLRQTLPLHHRLETCLLENVTSSQDNLGSFIAKRTDEAAANLQPRRSGRRGTGAERGGTCTTYKSILKSLKGLTLNL